MKNNKTQKGITLVALIITIIILLTLATVTITTITTDGLFVKAESAVGGYNKEVDNENTIIKDSIDYLDKYSKGNWTQEGSTLTQTNPDGTKTQIKIGDYVNYNAGTYTHTPEVAKGAGTSSTDKTLSTNKLTTEKNLTWRVLGINQKGELELISAKPTTQKLFLGSDKGYINAEDNLNNFCNDLYGHGTNNNGKKVATGARSLNVADINVLTNFNPYTFTNPYTSSKCGDIWTYKFPDLTDNKLNLGENLYYKIQNSEGTILQNWTAMTNDYYNKTFRVPGKKELSFTNPGEIEVTDSFYFYDIESELTTEDGFTTEETTTILNMITTGDTYWLASRAVQCNNYMGANFNVFAIGNYCIDNEYGDIMIPCAVHSLSLYNSNNSSLFPYFFYTENAYVRPVVTLSSDISLVGSGNDVGSVSNMWNIS